MFWYGLTEIKSCAIEKMCPKAAAGRSLTSRLTREDNAGRLPLGRVRIGSAFPVVTECLAQVAPARRSYRLGGLFHKANPVSSSRMSVETTEPEWRIAVRERIS